MANDSGKSKSASTSTSRGSSVKDFSEVVEQHQGHPEDDRHTGDVEKGPMAEKEKTGGLVTDSGPDGISPYHPSQYPDGGRDAWLCLLGSFCCLFCSFGWLNCVGVFQSYYQFHQLRAYSPSAIAWIASLEIFVMFVPGPVVGFLFDNHGPKYILLFGAFFHVFGLMMTSLCTEYWHFVLAQGIVSPLGLNCIFNAATNSSVTWFFKKRGAAFGIQAAGSGLGGIIFPIMTSRLIPKVGFGWTMRICAFLILGLLLIAFATVKSRLPPKKHNFNLKHFAEPFRDTRFNLTLAASFLFFMGVFVPVNFIEVQALAHGMSHNLATYLIVILNAASIFGRILPGILADRLGRFNTQMTFCYLASIFTLALALPASNNAAFISFAGLYGFAQGAYVALMPAQIASLAPPEKIGTYVGVIFSVTSFAGLMGNPIAGAIAKSDVKKVNLFAGVLLLAGASMFALTRFYVAKWKLWVRI